MKASIKLFVGLFVVCCLSSANQLVINVDQEDFSPMRESLWKVSVGNTIFSQDNSNFKKDAQGLGISIERDLYPQISAGAQLAILRSSTTAKNTDSFYNNEGNLSYRDSNYSEALTTAAFYGKFAIIEYPLNKWNLFEVNILGGLTHIEHAENTLELMYGASVSYNYDNLIGAEFNTKINFNTETINSVSLIGYF